MTKKVNDLLDLVNGLDCKNAVIQLVSEDQSRSNDFHLKEVLQMMTKKVLVSKKALFFSNVNNFGVLYIRCWNVLRMKMIWVSIPPDRYNVRLLYLVLLMISFWKGFNFYWSDTTYSDWNAWCIDFKLLFY